MKKALLLLCVICTFCTASLAQTNDETETTKPIHDTEIVRKCSTFDIEGKVYNNVTVTLKSNNLSWLQSDYVVKASVKDENDKKIYKKILKAYLYIFRNGQIQVGKPNFSQIIISRGSDGDDWVGIIREKEGVY